MQKGIKSARGKLSKGGFGWEMFQSTAQWAESNIKLTSQASAYAGNYSLDITPHMREMLADYDKSTTTFQWVKSSTQVSKTTYLFVVGIKTLSTVGGMVQIAIPIEAEVKGYLETKINPFIDSVPTYKKQITDRAKLFKVPTKDSIKITHNSKWVVTGNTQLARNAKSIQILLLDEIRLFKNGMADVSEFINRTKSYSKMGRKIVGVSSWEYAGDPIDQSYMDSELKKEWAMYCPNCHEHYYPTSNNLKFLTKTQYMEEFGKDEETYQMLDHLREAKKRKAHLECSYCRHTISSYTKDQLLKQGFCKFKVVAGDDNEGAESIGYLINALGTVFTPLDEIMTLMIKANESHSILARVYRDYLNELYNLQNKEILANHILKLGSSLPEWVVPDDTFKLFLGVDNQKDHLYWVLSAVTYSNNQYMVAHGKAMSNDVDDDFEFVRGLFNQTYQSKGGKYYHVSALGLDVRGYKEGSIDRIADAKSFLVSLSDDIETNGIGDQEVFGIMGVDKLLDDRHYRVSKRKEIVDDEEVTYQTLVMSNTAIKDDLSQIIGRTIDHVEAEEGERAFNYKRKLFYVNETTITEEKEFLTHNKDLQLKHYSMQLTAENKDMLDEGIWKKIRERNDYLDCHSMIYTLHIYYNIEYETKLYMRG